MSQRHKLSQEANLPKRARNPIKTQESWSLVAHACNPSYSGGRDQDHLCSKPAQA
jgi:hypothetical protein